MYLGIDPGATGAYALIQPSGRVEAWHTPRKVVRKPCRDRDKHGRIKYKTVYSNYDFDKLSSFFGQLRAFCNAKGMRVIAVIESQQGRPTDSKSTVFEVGRNQMLWETLAGIFGIEVKLLPPGVWKPRYVSVGADKQASVDICKKLFPNVPLTKKKDEARAEALLIADYYYRKARQGQFPKEAPQRRRPQKGG